jgi:Outer membrane protein beta-barrel domain
MKKIILGTLALCMCFTFLQAQYVPGIKGGLNVADLSNFSGDNRISGHFGVFVHKTLDPNWCIQPELLYSGQGQKYMTSFGERTLALSYIQIPVMAQYYPIRQLYFEAGPQIAFLTSASIKGDNIQKTEVDNSYNKADLGLNFGAGVMATHQLGFYARYSAGLLDVTSNDGINRQNRVGQIGMFVRLH